jgi:hypothetical protein
VYIEGAHGSREKGCRAAHVPGAVGKNKTVGLSSCLAAAASRFSTAYGKAMTPGHCITSTDAMTVEGKVDMFVNDVTSTLAP